MKVTVRQLRKIIRESMEQLELPFPHAWPPPGRKQNVTNREDLIAALKAAGYTIDWYEMGEKWDSELVQNDGSPFAIIMAGESHADLLPNGEPIFDYYSENYKKYDIGVHVKFMKFLDKHGWYAEWIDAGTVMLVPDWDSSGWNISK